MSDDMLVHFSSNSSNQSDQSLPTKIAKLEARMVGKGSSTASQQQGWPSVSSAGKFSGVAAEEMVEPCSSSDSDDDVSFIHFYLQDELCVYDVSDSVIFVAYLINDRDFQCRFSGRLWKFLFDCLSSM